MDDKEKVTEEVVETVNETSKEETAPTKQISKEFFEDIKNVSVELTDKLMEITVKYPEDQLSIMDTLTFFVGFYGLVVDTVTGELNINKDGEVQDQKEDTDAEDPAPSEDTDKAEE